jgi:hypothetical protein
MSPSRDALLSVLTVGLFAGSVFGGMARQDLLSAVLLIGAGLAAIRFRASVVAGFNQLPTWPMPRPTEPRMCRLWGLFVLALGLGQLVVVVGAWLFYAP